MGVDSIIEYQKKIRIENETKVNRALSNLKKGKKRITFKLVAEKAGVSDSTIYHNKKLAERVRQVKEVHNRKLGHKKVSGKSFVSKKDNKIKELENKIKKYREKIELIEEENKKLYGRLELKTQEILELKTQVNGLEKVRRL